MSELVLTCLGRAGSPVIRYRTNDLVRPTWKRAEDHRFVLLEGGVLGRTDDMMIIRGVNIFPSSVEQILRSFPEIVEYRMVAYRHGEMDGLTIEIEDRLASPRRVQEQLHLRLGLRVDVRSVPWQPATIRSQRQAFRGRAVASPWRGTRWSRHAAQPVSVVPAALPCINRTERADTYRSPLCC